MSINLKIKFKNQEFEIYADQYDLFSDIQRIISVILNIDEDIILLDEEDNELQPNWSILDLGIKKCSIIKVKTSEEKTIKIYFQKKTTIFSSLNQVLLIIF